MRAPLTEAFHVLLSLPFWVFIALLAGTAWAWRSERGTRAHRWRHAWLAAAAIFYVASIPATHAWLESSLETWYPVPRVEAAERNADNVILVLTAGWLRRTPAGYEQKIGEAGWERTAAAVELWKRIGGRLLFTGAPAPDGRDSAAAAMARVAQALGVPREAILVEAASLNTHENFTFSRRMLGARPGRIWLVTSALHMPRSVAAARAVGLEVTPYPCDFRADARLSWTMLLPANSARGALERALHELAGLVAYRLRGWG